MSTERIPPALATDLLAVDSGDFAALRAHSKTPQEGPPTEGRRFEAARPRRVGEIRNTRGGIWGGNDSKTLFDSFLNRNLSSVPKELLDNGEAGQGNLDGFEGRFRFSIPEPQPKKKLDI